MNRELAVSEMKAVFKILSDDIEEIRDYGKANASDFAHRSLLRTHFAFIEGMAYQLRQVTLYSVTEHPDFFSPEELSILKEEQYTLNKKGEIETRENYQKLLPMILFTISCYSRIHGANYRPDTGINGWRSMQKYLGIRNQLMHPKSTADLVLSDDKLKFSIEAAEWFKQTLQDMFATCSSSNRKYEG